MLEIGHVSAEEGDQWVALRQKLWQEGADTHASEVDAFLSGSAEHPEAVLVARDGGRVVGFAELAVRRFAEGCATDRVGYLEGWYVEETFRRRGVGRALVSAAEKWARQQGCRELASDASADNEVSVRAHLGCGFEDAGTVRCFRKRLDEEFAEGDAPGEVRAAALDVDRSVPRPDARVGVPGLRKVDLKKKLASFSDLWSPRIVGQVNDVHVKLAKLRGEFPWHRHEGEDELFLVLEGRLRLEFHDREVWLAPGEMVIVPRGTEHRPVAEEEVHVLLVEPAGTLNTGDVRNERTVQDPEWI